MQGSLSKSGQVCMLSSPSTCPHSSPSLLPPLTPPWWGEAPRKQCWDSAIVAASHGLLEGSHRPLIQASIWRTCLLLCVPDRLAAQCKIPHLHSDHLPCVPLLHALFGFGGRPEAIPDGCCLFTRL